MDIKLHEIPIREIVKDYIDNNENGVIGYDGRLNIRPPFQREFVYNDKQRDEVIKTIMNNFPLNVMYWIKNIYGTYELLDGQQRTVSICQYVTGIFSINSLFFHNLTESEQNQLLDYKLMIYCCDGTDKEKLDWFKIINIAGEKLTSQELRNAIYTGQWLTEAKKWFSKTGCAAYGIANRYVKGTAIRQDYLETSIKWISSRDGLREIEDYMAIHQHDPNANELWLYFQNVVNWIKVIFPNWRKDMRGLEWGILYNKYKANRYDSDALERKIRELIEDDEVENKKGVYEFLLSGETNQTVLNLRAFKENITIKVYERQKGICPKCNSEQYEFEEMEADHIVPWNKGGETVEENCQMLCMHHNRTKSGK